MRKNLEYLYNIARQMMGVNKTWKYMSNHPGIVDGMAFHRLFLSDVSRDLREWGDDKLGMIAGLGRGGGSVTCDTNGEATKEDEETNRRFGIPHRATLTDVGLGQAMTEFMGGRRLLLIIASLTIIAAMLDLARNHQKTKVMAEHA